MNLLSSAKWNALSQFFKIFIQLVNMVYLATIIPPTEYGIMAMAAVVINLGVLLRDLGTASAIIQRKDLSHSLINAIFWLNLILGLILCLVVLLLSPIIAHVYKQSELTSVLILLSLTFPLSSCGAVHLALLERISLFKKISLVEISSSLFSVLIAIILANMGFGVYSLVVQAIIMSLLSSILFWHYSDWRPTMPSIKMFKNLNEIYSFSANLSFFNIINYFSRNADSFVIGKYMSAFTLGNYNLAYRIMLFPIASLTFVFGRSLYPILSRHQDNKSYIKKIYLDCVFYILIISAPLMTGIAIFSHPFISIVFSPKWTLTADILVWLAPTAILQSVISTTGAVFSSQNKTGLLFIMGIIGSSLMLSAFIVGVNYDIIIFAKLYLIANVINFFPPIYFSLKILESNFSELIKKITPVILSTLLMMYVLKAIVFSMNVNISTFGELMYYSCLGALFYFIFLLVLSKEVRVIVFSKFF